MGMISLVVNKYNEIEEYVIKNLRIPLIYILFIITVFLLMNPKYIELLEVYKWFPTNIKQILLTFFNSIYSNSTFVVIVCISLYITGNLVISFSFWIRGRIRKKRDVVYGKRSFYRKEIKRTDGTTDTWNEYRAVRMPMYFLESFSTTFFIIYLFINTLLNGLDFHMFDLKDPSENSVILVLFFLLNILICIKYIINYFFIINLPTREYAFDSEDLGKYITLNSCRYNQGRDQTEEFEYLLLKTKYNDVDKFLIVKVQLSQYCLHKNGFRKNEEVWGVKKLGPGELTYYVINSSKNFSEIQYHFESLVLKHR